MRRMNRRGKNGRQLLGVLGDSRRVKVWVFLLIGRSFEYKVSDTAKGSNISRPTCYSELKDLLAKGVVIKGSKYKWKQLCKLNNESAIVKAMIKAFDTMLYKNQFFISMNSL